MLNRLIKTALLACASLLAASPAAAMTALDDEELVEHTGEGLAFALDDFRFLMSADSYIEQVGSAVPTNCASAGCTSAGGGGVAGVGPVWTTTVPYNAAAHNPRSVATAGNYFSFVRGDLRWYGLSISSTSNDQTAGNWDGSTCVGASGIDGLGCPRGGYIDNFSPYDNPYVLRAFSYSDILYDGTTGARTVLELLAPTDQPFYRFSFWGETEAGKNVTCTGTACGTRTLKSQSIIQGNAEGSVLRIFQFSNAADPTFGLYYHSFLQGDYRFTVKQVATNDTIGVPVAFDQFEGIHFKNVRAFLPLGQLHYQAITLDDTPAKNGNFFVELTLLPDTAGVYNAHYALNANDVSGYGGSDYTGTGAAVGSGYATALYAVRCPLLNCGASFTVNGVANAALQPATRYSTTHGYVRWGDRACNGSSCTAGADDAGGVNTTDAVNDGIFFLGSGYAAATTTFQSFARRPTVISMATGSAVPTWQNSTANGVNRYRVNLGDARIEGLMLHKLRITSLGANL